jgi:hypothetical protein
LEKILKAHCLQQKPQIKVPYIHQLEKLYELSNIDIDKDTTQFLEELNKDYKRVRYSDLSQKSYNTLKKTGPVFKKGVKLYVCFLNILSMH